MHMQGTQRPKLLQLIERKCVPSERQWFWFFVFHWFPFVPRTWNAQVCPFLCTYFWDPEMLMVAQQDLWHSHWSGNREVNVICQSQPTFLKRQVPPVIPKPLSSLTRASGSGWNAKPWLILPAHPVPHLFFTKEAWSIEASSFVFLTRLVPLPRRGAPLSINIFIKVGRPATERPGAAWASPCAFSWFCLDSRLPGHKHCCQRPAETRPRTQALWRMSA